MPCHFQAFLENPFFSLNNKGQQSSESRGYLIHCLAPSQVLLVPLSLSTTRFSIVPVIWGD